MKPKRTVAPWLDLLVLVAADPETDWQSVIVNRAESPRSGVDRIVYVPAGVDPAERRKRALSALGVAVDCFRRAHTEPIPLFSSLSKKLHTGAAKPSDWESFKGYADGDDTANALVFGEHDYTSLLEVPCEPFDPPGTEEQRAMRYARWLWCAMDDSVIVSDGAGTGAPSQEAER